MAVSEYVLMAHCRKCAINVQLRRADDPFLREFIPWSVEDKEYIAEAALNERVVKCPTDNTLLEPTMHPNGLKTIVRARCGRCGQSLSESFPRDS